MVDLTIAIASCGRPVLSRTLASLDAMDVPDGFAIEVMVADDDPSGKAAKIVSSLGPCKHPVRCVKVAARNISHARNACLDAAKGNLIAFIDDDEWVAPDWLERMLACRKEFGASCVFGPVFPQYPQNAPAWIVRANPLYDDWGARGAVVTTGRSGNTLFDRVFARRHALRFDPALGSTGGEDTAFFAAFHRAGGKLVITDDAAVFEEAPAERLTLAYLRTRALRSGQSWAQIALYERSGFAARAIFALDAFAKMAAAFTVAIAMLPLDRATSLRFAIKGWSNFGKLRDVAGRAMTPIYHPRPTVTEK